MIKESGVVKESININGFGIIIIFKHEQLGLPKNTTLTSINSGDRWKVKARILHYHINDKHRIFNNEETIFSRISFSSIEGRKNSIQRTIEQEASGIYEYLLEPIDHSNKPKQGEKLEISLQSIE